MNKNLFDQLPADEQPVAAKLNSTAANMKVPQNFQWTLESQLMDAYKNRSQPVKGWVTKILAPTGWALVAVLGIVLLNWAIRSLVPSEATIPSTSNTETPPETFETKVRQGSICTGPLALAHGFSVSLTDQDKTGFITLDEEKIIGELRSFAWSPDGEHLAVVGNTRGSGNIYLTDSGKAPLQPVLANSELGYLMDVAWSRDGERLLMWPIHDNTRVYLVNADGSGLEEIQLGMQLIGTPQFAPDGTSIIFVGADSSAFGLFEFALDGSQTRMISSLVENESAFAWSPDGTHIAYMMADRTLGEALLVAEEYASGEKTVLATLPIPKGSGSSIPDIANLSWSQDGTNLVFEFGRYATNRVIYLAYADGNGLVKMVDSAHAPTISADGNCLAYISNDQVFLIDLTTVSLTSSPATPLLLADLPAPRGTPNFLLDKLQWKP